MNKDGTNRVPVRSLNNPEWIEPCGRFLLAVTSTNGEKVLTRVVPDGTNETALTSGDVLCPACSPDGQSAYYLNAVHPQKIRKISLLDGSISEIADIPGDSLFWNIVVSPDGKYLAYPYQQYSPPVVELAVIPFMEVIPSTNSRFPASWELSDRRTERRCTTCYEQRCVRFGSSH
jgi:hypothetical protein